MMKTMTMRKTVTQHQTVIYELSVKTIDIHGRKDYNVEGFCGCC
jgi:hypothetical protein